MTHRERLKLRGKRRQRHNVVWCILRLIITYRDLVSSSNFHDFKNNKDAYLIAKNEYKEYSPDRGLIEVAIRLCQYKYKQGNCDHKLSDNEICAIYKLIDTPIDYEALLCQVTLSFETYWDDVLVSYAKPSARTKRIKYLIEETKRLIKEYAQYPMLIERIKELQLRYEAMLTQ